MAKVIEDKKPEKLTRQRQAILQAIRDSGDHPTANEIFQLARERLPTLSYATVYNSLRYLKEAGLVRKIKFGDTASRYDRMTHRHDHAICNDCGKLVDFELPETAELIQAAADRKSTRLNSSHLVISYAVFCLKKKNKNLG